MVKPQHNTYNPLLGQATQKGLTIIVQTFSRGELSETPDLNANILQLATDGFWGNALYWEKNSRNATSFGTR